MIVEDYVLKLQIENTCRFLGKDGEENHHSFRSSMSQAELKKNGSASWEAT